jgi:hypothetical protein
MPSTMLSLKRMQDDDVVWRLFRATNASVVIAILDSHLGGMVRRLPVAELVGLVDIDLQELRLRTSLELPLTAGEYCEQWRSDGYLVRRPVSQARQETYELSSGATTVISFAKRLIQPHRTATQSRLNTIINQISSLAREVPDDFVNVRDGFEMINKSLHAQIINGEAGYRDVLDDVFSGVDRISQSPYGRSFKGFFSLLRDSDLTEAVQDDIEAILDSDFAKPLEADERRFLRELLGSFLEQSLEVNATMTAFARGLRRFVLNQDYQRDRMLKRQIDQALGAAQQMLERYPANQRLGSTLDLTAADVAPVSRWTLTNPAESRAAALCATLAFNPGTMTIEQLRELARETEIDFHELARDVSRCLDQARAAGGMAVSLAQVLEECPASQGAASVIGLMVLATEQGRPCEGSELLHWQTKAGAWRQASVGRLEFYKDVSL